MKESKSHSEMAKIDLCNLDQNFYLSVGIAPPEEADEGCTSWVEDVRAGRAFIQIDVLDSSIRKNPEYRTDSAENMSGQETHQWRVAGHTRTGEAEKCLAFSNHPMMSNVAITSESSCEVLTPMAQQINNLITQYEFADRNFRLLDFSQPEYTEVTPVKATYNNEQIEAVKMYVVPALREVEVEDPRFDGSTLRLESASYFDDELCIKARYKLGQETSALPLTSPFLT